MNHALWGFSLNAGLCCIQTFCKTCDCLVQVKKQSWLNETDRDFRYLSFGNLTYKFRTQPRKLMSYQPTTLTYECNTTKCPQPGLMVWKMETIAVCTLPECKPMMSIVLRIYFFVPTAITEIHHCHPFYVKVRSGVSDVV